MASCPAVRNLAPEPPSGTGLAAGGVVVAGAGLAAGSAGALAGAARGTAALAGSASGAFRAGGLSGVADAAASAMTSPLRRAAASKRLGINWWHCGR